MKPLALTTRLVVLLASAVAWAGAADPLAQAMQHADRREHLDAIQAAMVVAKSPKETAARRFEAFRRAATSYVAIGCPRMAVATYHQALLALGRYNEHASQAWRRIAEVHLARGQWHEARAFLESALAQLELARLPREEQFALLACLVRCCERFGELHEALAIAEAMAPRAKSPDELAGALGSAAKLHAELHDFEKAKACLARLGEATLADGSARYEVARAYEEVCQRLAGAGRREEARALCVKALALFGAREPSRAQALMRQLLELTDSDDAVLDEIASLKGAATLAVASDEVLAQLVPIAARARRADDLVRTCTQAMLAKPLDETVARVCLGGIVDLRLRQGRTDDALAAARACYSVTGFQTTSTSSFAISVALVGHALRARDGHLVTGNAFRNYQVYGPHGPDRKPGTPDDLASPFAKLAVTPQPALDPLFEAALAAQPPTLEGQRARGWIYLLWSKPDKALGAFKRAFALAPLDNSQLARAAQDIALALKARQATPVGMDAFARFQRYGPHGPDGKAGTADDLKDPLAGL